MDELLLNAGISDPAKRAKCGNTMKDLMNDMAKQAVEKSDQAWEARLPTLVRSVKAEAMQELEAKLSSRDTEIDTKFAKILEATRSDKVQVQQTLAAFDSKMIKVGADSAEVNAKLMSLQSDVENIQNGRTGLLDGGSGGGGGGEGKGQGLGGGGGGKGSGKGMGKDAKKLDERKRTLVFSNFPEDTQDTDIISFIKETLGEVSEELQETFAYDRTGTRGAARFVCEDSMWRYMTDNKGKQRATFVFEGGSGQGNS